MSIRSCRDLRVWQTAMDLAETRYRLAASFPRDEPLGQSVLDTCESAGKMPRALIRSVERSSKAP